MEDYVLYYYCVKYKDIIALSQQGAWNVKF